MIKCIDFHRRVINIFQFPQLFTMELICLTEEITISSHCYLDIVRRVVHEVRMSWRWWRNPGIQNLTGIGYKWKLLARVQLHPLHHLADLDPVSK